MKYDATTFSLIPTGELGEVLVVYREAERGKYEVLAPLEFRQVDTGAPHSLFTIKANMPGGQPSYRNEIDEFLQAMMDAAWRRGLRPKGVEDSTRELKATKFHLEDMRQLAGVKK